jgi:DNA invertase Pin-like site-specific DNA recombinase
LLDALQALREQRASGLVVYRLDRLARDLIIQETLLAEIRRLGADVFSTSAAESDYLRDDADDPSRRLIRQILGAVAEYERAMIALRLRAGRRRKAETGGYAYGSPALGYRAEDGALVPAPDEQATLERIRELHDKGASLRSIAETLSAEGFRPKRSSTWHPESVRRAIARL